MIHALIMSQTTDGEELMNGKQIKRMFSLNNIISFAVLAIAIYFRGPEIMKNFRSEGIILKNITSFLLMEGKQRYFSHQKSPRP